jgi:4a-hydroxytetrahydrobiopterin dehydratase
MTETLAEKRCVRCRGGIPPLTRDATQRFQTQAPNWKLRDDANRIERIFRFGNFQGARRFVRKSVTWPKLKAITPTSGSAGVTRPSP